MEKSSRPCSLDTKKDSDRDGGRMRPSEKVKRSGSVDVLWIMVRRDAAKVDVKGSEEVESFL